MVLRPIYAPKNFLENLLNFIFWPVWNRPRYYRGISFQISALTSKFFLLRYWRKIIFYKLFSRCRIRTHASRMMFRRANHYTTAANKFIYILNNKNHLIVKYFLLYKTTNWLIDWLLFFFQLLFVLGTFNNTKKRFGKYKKNESKENRES